MENNGRQLWSSPCVFDEPKFSPDGSLVGIRLSETDSAIYRTETGDIVGHLRLRRMTGKC